MCIGLSISRTIIEAHGGVVRHRLGLAGEAEFGFSFVRVLVFNIFGSPAQFERDLIGERTNAGLTDARERGSLGGRRPVITPDKLHKARDHIAAGLTVGVAALFGFAMPALSTRIGPARTHVVRVLCGALGHASFFIVPDATWLIGSMVLVSIAWSSILTIPYAILAPILPPAAGQRQRGAPSKVERVR